MKYSGPFDAWDMRQTAIAAARYPGFDPNWEGLNKLQERWWESGAPSPGTVHIEGVELPMDMKWASKAFLYIATSCR